MRNCASGNDSLNWMSVLSSVIASASEAIHGAASRGMDCFASLAMTMWGEQVRQNNPTGKSVLIYGNHVKPNSEIKNISVFQKANQAHIFAIPSHSEGRRPSSRTLDGLRWTLVYASTTAWISVRQNRVVLAPVAGVKLSEKRKRKRQRRSQPRTRLRGDHGISRKAIAQGRPGVLRCPVCSCAAFLCKSHTRPRVQRAPGLPCAL